MQKVNVFELEGTAFPAGRRTRVLIGDNGAIRPEWVLSGEAQAREAMFCQGYVIIHPGGSIPAHAHLAVESYTILSGQGEMLVNGESAPVQSGDCVLVSSGHEHALRNKGTEDLHMIFVYAPGVIADHWGQELAGTLS